jgi:hypothetical protein
MSEPTENPNPTPADNLAARIENHSLLRQAMHQAVAASGCGGHAAIERYLIEQEKQRGIFEPLVEKLPAERKVQAMAVVAELVHETVAFARYTEDPDRYFALWDVSARYNNLSTFGKGE